jgi:hypothetical protein
MKEVSKRFINLHQHYNPLQCLQASMVRHSLKVLSNEMDLVVNSVITEGRGTGDFMRILPAPHPLRALLSLPASSH